MEWRGTKNIIDFGSIFYGLRFSIEVAKRKCKSLSGGERIITVL